MSDDLDLVLRSARPPIVQASDEATERVRGAVGAPQPKPQHRSAKTPRRVLVLALVALCIGGAFVTGILVAPSSGKTLVGSVALQSVGPDLGVSITLPSGWTGRVYNEQPPTEQAAAYLQAASFPLSSGVESDIGSDVAGSMRAEDIFLVLLEVNGAGGGFSFPPLDDAPRIAQSDLGASLEGVPPHHAVARIFFTAEDRKFILMVQFGEDPPTAEQLGLVNSALQTLRIQKR